MALIQASRSKGRQHHSDSRTCVSVVSVAHMVFALVYAAAVSIARAAVVCIVWSFGAICAAHSMSSVLCCAAYIGTWDPPAMFLCIAWLAYHRLICIRASVCTITIARTVRTGVVGFLVFSCIYIGSAIRTPHCIPVAECLSILDYGCNLLHHVLRFSEGACFLSLALTACSAVQTSFLSKTGSPFDSFSPRPSPVCGLRAVHCRCGMVVWLLSQSSVADVDAPWVEAVFPINESRALHRHRTSAVDHVPAATFTFILQDKDKPTEILIDLDLDCTVHDAAVFVSSILNIPAYERSSQFVHLTCL